jgi:amino acid adenylation domain-containing protein
MNEVKKTVDSLSRRKLALLSERLKAGIVKTPRREISRRSNPTAPCPLSFAQQRLWFIDQLEPGNTVYNCPEEVRLEGRLNLEALERVINEVVRRHEVLRTRMEVSAEGEPMQVIDEWEPRRLEVEDLASLSPEERQREALRRAREEAGTGFDLKRGPLLRVKVLRLEEEDHVLLCTMHHIVSDWWSMGILVREVGELYRAYDAGESSPLEELPIQYADFAVWQREWLSGAVLEKELDYWRVQLAEAESLELPTDHPRPATQSHRGARHHFVIEEAVAEKLRALSQREGVTLFMTLLGGFDVVMSRYSGQEDIVLGTDIANRNRAEIEGLIGFFVNQLVMRVNVKGRESFRELLKRVREVCLGAYAHQDVPFEKLVEELQLKRDLSRAPLFQAKLILQNAERERPELGSAKLSGLGDGAEMANVMKAAKIDLTVAIVEAGRDLVVATEYDRELFEPATIERLIGHYGNILKGIVEEEERAVSELSLLSDEEREQIVEEWNQTARMYPGEECLHELFAKQARQAPERIAVVSEWEQVSYRELNRRANQLGRYLQRLGVGPEVVVGLCLERSVEMVVGALGALKAGGVYLPLDAESPLERLGYMLEDAGVGAVLTQRALEGRLPVFWGQTVLLDEEWERIEEESDSEPEREVDAENLAYVIYTSGSTGRPKGVGISHRNLLNSTIARRHFYKGGPDRFLLLSSFTFDSSVAGIFWTLLEGGTLALPPENAQRDPIQIAELLTQNQITHTLALPLLYQSILEVADPQQTLSLRVAIVAGEACLSNLPSLHFSKTTDADLFNEYGPTEGAVWSAAWKCADDSPGKRIPIGKPIANARMYILDEYLEAAPIGAKGEIYISGAGLARGYLGKAELTAERFIPNRFGGKDGERMYRTGDVGRYLPDGNLEFIGRADRQVKVRGYRIELGEIEAVLDEHESVIQSVVVMKEDDMAEKRLVAYVVCDGERAPSVYELRSYLKEKLPEHMAPALFVWLEQMPLTPNGKVDRKALKVLKEGRIEPQTAYIPPRDSFELQIVQIWEQVLGIQPIGVTDNFFELGGHSLLAVSLMAKIRNTLKQDLPLSALFQGATVEKLGAMLRRDASSRSWSCLVELQAFGSKPPLFFVHPGGGGVLCYFDLARCLGSDQPFYGFQAPGFYGEQLSHTRLEDIAALYIEAMMTVQPEGPYLLGGWSLGGVIAYEMAQQLVAQGQSVGQLLLLDAGPGGPSEEDIGEHEDHLEYEEPARMDDALFLVGFFQGDLPLSEEDLKPFEGDERIDYVLKKAISMNLVPPGIEVAQAHSVLKSARANEKARNNYKAQAYPGAVTLFKTAGKASMPHSVGPEFNEEMMKRIQDPTMGWGELAAGGVRVIDVPGDHGTMVLKPYVETLAVRIKECLNGAETLGS